MMNERDDLLRDTNELATAVYKTGARIERERIIRLLETHITPANAYAAGLEQAIAIINEDTSCSKCNDCC